jgi:capsular exopolysaccharide synthesis family protein
VPPRGERSAATIGPINVDLHDPGAGTGNQSATLEQLLQVVRRRWRLLGLCVVLATAAAVGFSLLQRNEYTASASLLFSDNNFAQQLFGSNFTSSVDDPTQEQATNLDLVALPIVASNTAAALNLPTALVKSETSVSGSGQANIAKVSVTDPHPARAAQIANTYVQQFVLFRRTADRAQIAGARKLVQKELAALPPSQRDSSVGQTLQNRANQLGVLAALQTGNAEVAQPAGVPSSPSSPQTKLNGLLGALFGVLLGAGLVLVSERLDRRIRDASEFETLYEVPLLGVIPESVAYEHSGVERLPVAESEAFALLRARLRYFNVDRELRTLLITSATPGEGKTTVGLNLAIAEAAGGSSNVILLEADLRRPALARRLKLSSGPGLAEILSRNATLEEAVQWLPIRRTTDQNGSGPQISVVTAGAVPPNPAQLLESRAMVDLLTSLTERFDLVVVDSAPTSVVSDSIALVKLVSGVVVVSRVGRTTREAARHLRNQLVKLEAPTLGVIANALPLKGRGYYGYGYGYGYGYSREGDGYLADAAGVAGAGDVEGNLELDQTAISDALSD